jgi:hypothetical protein
MGTDGGGLNLKDRLLRLTKKLQPDEVGGRRLMAGRVEHPRSWKPGLKNGALTPGLL